MSFILEMLFILCNKIEFVIETDHAKWQEKTL